MSNKNDKLSVFISLILRHKPDVIDIKLDKYGYANVDELIDKVNKSGRYLSLDILKEIVKTDKKGRYSFNNNFSKIRANQGHSIYVEVDMKELEAPPVLFHGTATKNLSSILSDGIKKMNRLYVHLSSDTETALNVGKRHGEPLILKINTYKMNQDGYKFYLSENGVWLTDFVPNSYIERI
ncbi:RNA 2'-phosphotransferase [Clostridioides sp. ZZV14-6045]|uniref:RNA 2'-phosphotransferase n=1 Tax=Clostridioides sp. ZZV14-6045 TaxID=2811489 RepID=UPI001D12F5DF|nr:RNA 2'-phosphotransferase [Clostridioides sp. ZZV14-6045]